jgi:hypothetical protein
MVSLTWITERILSRGLTTPKTSPVFSTKAILVNTEMSKLDALGRTQWNFGFGPRRRNLRSTIDQIFSLRDGVA